ncbi:MAG: CBS domain-containing protein [Actinomycetales bacterium]|nr:CBS domain-containing protein [Actinomycetales bacterium]
MTAAESLARRPEMTVADLMSNPVLTVEVNESLWDAWQLLFVSGLRHLVVLDRDGGCLGVLSDRNILAEVPATADHLSHRHVRDVLAMVPLVSVHPEDPPLSVAQLMADHTVEAVPVLDAEGRLAGIVTESDIVRWLVR